LSGKNQRYIILAGPLGTKDVAGFGGGIEDIILPFSVDAKVELEKRGVKCLFPDEIVDPPDLNSLGRENMSRVREICEMVDRSLRERLPFLGESNIDLLGGIFYQVKIFFDALISSYLILADLLPLLIGREIIVCRDPGKLDKIIGGRTPLVPLLIEHIFKPAFNNIKIYPLRSDAGCLCGNKEDYYDLAELIRLGRQTWTGINVRGSGKEKIVVLDHRYDLRVWTEYCSSAREFYKIFLFKRWVVLKSLYSRSVRAFTVSRGAGEGYPVAAAIHEAGKELAGHDIFQGNPALGRFAFLCLAAHVAKSLGSIERPGQAIRKALADMAPAFLCTASCRLEMKEAFILGIAKSLGIPIVTYQEGGGAGYLDWPLFDLDTDWSDYFLVYGDGVAESPYVDKKKAHVIPVGSLYLGEVGKNIVRAEREDATEEIYLILDNIKTGTWQHYPYNGGSFFQAYRHQLKIIDMLKEASEGRFVLKTVKGREDLYGEAAAHDDRMRIETKPLAAVLHRAAAFILDYPSTVLQECLQTDKPIALILNSDYVKFEPRALELLKKRAYVTFDYDEFSEVLKMIHRDLKNGNPMVKNREFLIAYCCPEYDKKKIDDVLGNISVGRMGMAVRRKVP